jgi:hypothetical protein
MLYQPESDSCEIPPIATAVAENSFEFEIERSAILDERLACVRHIMALKEQIVSDLIAGRVTLADAATRFHELENITPGANHRVFQAAYPGATELERYCRQVIDSAIGVNASDSPANEALCSRLETEFKRQFCRAPQIATD